MATTLAAQPIAKVSASDLVRDLDLTDEEVLYVLDLAAKMKRSPAKYARALTGKYIGLLFEKPSLRTRLTFELAIKQLGGDSVTCEGPVGAREPLKDVARNLERWVQGIVARTFLQSTIEELAHWSSAPVINALSDLYHPCQALADVFTLREQFDELRGLKLAFVGDGNNVAHSLMLTAVRLGMDFAIATPEGYAPDPDIVAQAEGLAAISGAQVELTSDPKRAVAAAHAVYTDVWTSMGKEKEAAERRKSFARYQVNDQLMALARPDAVFMHCLPAKRGEEVTDEVMESDRSIVFDQAENRLHAQKALLVMMLG
ncbi:MAG TPA: ornithine carbamoyltransferase [Bryobacteraceae bacterium]|nr:ornithine carbamoyltransferase [Bryobacteraceae bacterium]